MTTRAEAAASWRQKWPEMTDILSDYPRYPAHNVVVNNTFLSQLERGGSRVHFEQRGPKLSKCWRGLRASFEEIKSYSAQQHGDAWLLTKNVRAVVLNRTVPSFRVSLPTLRLVLRISLE